MPELDALSRHFDRIVIVPMQRKSDDIIDIPQQNISVDFTVADNRSIKVKLPLLFSHYVLKNLPAILSGENGIRYFFSRWSFAMNIELFRRGIEKVIKSNSLDLKNTLAYTFWFDYTTIALTDFGITTISRAHGFDVYDAVYAPYMASHLRRNAIKKSAGIFTVSSHGEQYLRHRYPGNDDKISTRYLGSVKPVLDDLSPSSYSGSDTVTFLSVARVAPVKGVWRNIALVKELGKRYPDKIFRWIHIGDGPCMKRLQHEISSELPENVKVELKGALPNNEVHNLYRNESIDWSILLSDSEGIPVSIMESMSYGVPVIVSNVGGLPELVTADCGYLIGPNLTSSEMADAVSQAVENPQLRRSMSKAAFIRWKENFAASALRENFAIEISNLLSDSVKKVRRHTP